MDGRERVMNIFNKKKVDHNAFWLGIPHKDTKKIYSQYYNAKDDIDLNLKLGSDIYCAVAFSESWKHPEGRYFFDILPWEERTSLSQEGVFAKYEDFSEIENFTWPTIQYLDLSDSITNAKKARENGLAVLGGVWACFFHDMCELFGMENYFVNMYANPEFTLQVTERIMEYYMEANRFCFETMGDLIDIFYFGNDLGSQLDLLISPECFDKFILPYTVQIIKLAKQYGLPVMMHSCGSISRIIPKLIEAGIDALHPIQAKAVGMNADSLSKYKNDLIFVGGVDTQELLPFGTTHQVRDEVKRLKSIFGDRLIISPSHETLLPNVGIENVIAMAQEAIA